MKIYWRSSGFIAGSKCPISGSTPYAVAYSVDKDDELHEVAWLQKYGFFFSKPRFVVEFITSRLQFDTLELAKAYVVKHFESMK